MMSFKYGLISSRFYLIGRVLFLSPLISFIFDRTVAIKINGL